MDLPLCKICGERHRLGHCPEWDEPPPFPNKKAFLREWHDAPKAAPPTPQADEPDQAQEPAQTKAPEVKPKFDKVAYQRELMRKRRAALRASRPQPVQSP